jgi:hypothetical protein
MRACPRGKVLPANGPGRCLQADLNHPARVPALVLFSLVNLTALSPMASRAYPN